MVKRTGIIVGISLWVLTLFSQPLMAMEECHIISVNSSAWISTQGNSIKRSAQSGDILKSDETLHVAHGNYVQLALDGDEDNVLHVGGKADLTVASVRSHQIELNQGHLFAVLDDLGAGSKFEVVTPQAIASVRGTYFSIFANSQSTQATTYEGSLYVAGKPADGRIFLLQPMILKPAQTVMIEGPKNILGAAQTVTRSAFDKINDIIGLFAKDRVLLNYEEARSALKESAVPSPLKKYQGVLKTSDRNVDADKAAKDRDKLKSKKNKSSEGQIIF